MKNGQPQEAKAATRAGATNAGHSEFAYRPEVDGLRAIAVIPVVLYHAGFAWFSGGYVGVDVFFVISGYLIASIILSEKSAGTFSIAKFYERRARRILPALFLVMLASLPFAWFVMTPHYLKGFSQSLVAASVFAPNVYFFLKSGYFEPGADETPLLHTWSLGVEEQYYIGFPLLVLLCWKWGLKALAWVLGVTALISLGLSEWASRAHPVGNFYLGPTRAWELALGCLLAIASSSGLPGQRLTTATRNLIAITGFALILVPVFVYHESTPFPGVYALAPTIGTFLILAFAHSDTVVARFLSLKWVVGVGLISYSVYLWHQPMFAFARLHGVGKPSPILLGVLSAFSLVLGYVTWRFVEKTVRDRRRFSRKQIFTWALAASLAFIALGSLGHLAGGFPSRLTPAQREIIAFGDNPANHKLGYPGADCFLLPDQDSAAFGECADGPDGAGTVFLWGDSHAAHLYSGLKKVLGERQRLIYFTASACPPILHVSFFAPHCRDINDFVFSKLTRAMPERVILAAVWGNYDWKPLAQTLDELAKAGIRNVDVIGPVPRWHPSLPIVLARFNVPFSALPLHTSLGLDPAVRRIDAEMRLLAQEHGAHYISPFSILCETGDGGCRTRVGDQVESMMQWDVSHLTPAGSEFLVSRFR